MKTYTQAVIPADVALRKFSAGQALLMESYRYLEDAATQADALEQEATDAEYEYAKAVGGWGCLGFHWRSHAYLVHQLAAMRTAVDSAVAAASSGADLHLSPAEVNAMNAWEAGEPVEEFRRLTAHVTADATDRLEKARKKLDALVAENAKQPKSEDQAEPVAGPVQERRAEPADAVHPLVWGAFVGFLLVVAFILGRAMGGAP